MTTFIAAAALALASLAAGGVCEAGETDSDLDGLSDACELEIAARFAPVMVLSTSACNWSGERELLDGGYLFGVRPTDAGFLIAYLDELERAAG